MSLKLYFTLSKKITLLFIIVVFSLLYGCENNTTENTNLEAPSITEESQNTIISILMPVNQYKPMYENISVWQEMLKDKYKIEMDLQYVTDFNEYVNGTYITDQISMGYSGLIYLWDYTDDKVTELAHSGAIIPITEYLETNKVYNSFPAGMTGRYSFEDEIWGIPAMYAVTPIARVSKNDWLTNLDIEVPATVAELYNMFKAFTYDDPNNSGQYDTFGLSITRNHELRNLGDIFLANGCYIDPYGLSSISLDRETNSYEDAFLKSGARISLDMIVSMVDEKLIKQVDYSSTNAFEKEENDGSYYYFINSIDDLEKHTIIWFVEGTNKEYLCRANTGSGCYVLSGNTENPKEVVDAFINAFYGSPEGYYMALGGIKGIDYKSEGKKYIEIAGKNGARILELYSPYLKSNGYSYVNENNETRAKNLEYLTESSESLFNLDKLYFTSLQDTPFGTTTNYYPAKLISSLISGDIDSEDFLTEYRTKMKTSGIQNLIDSKNESIGKTTNYKY